MNSRLRRWHATPYTASGELRAVYDRSGTQVRGFTYDAEHAGRMVAHYIMQGGRRAITGMMILPGG